MHILVFFVALVPYALGLIVLYFVIYHAVSNAINDQLEKPKILKLLRRLDASREELNQTSEVS